MIFIRLKAHWKYKGNWHPYWQMVFFSYVIYVHFNILNLKIKIRPISFVFSGISFVFPMCFGPDEDHLQIKWNFRKLLFIHMLMTSTQKINDFFILFIFINTSVTCMKCQIQQRLTMTTCLHRLYISWGISVRHDLWQTNIVAKHE